MLLSAQHLQLGPAGSLLTIPGRFAWLSASGATRSRRQRCAGESKRGGIRAGGGQQGAARAQGPSVPCPARSLQRDRGAGAVVCTPETPVVCGVGLVLGWLCPGGLRLGSQSCLEPAAPLAACPAPGRLTGAVCCLGELLPFPSLLLLLGKRPRAINGPVSRVLWERQEWPGTRAGVLLPTEEPPQWGQVEKRGCSPP